MGTIREKRAPLPQSAAIAGRLLDRSPDFMAGASVAEPLDYKYRTPRTAPPPAKKPTPSADAIAGKLMVGRPDLGSAEALAKTTDQLPDKVSRTSDAIFGPAGEGRSDIERQLRYSQDIGQLPRADRPLLGNEGEAKNIVGQLRSQYHDNARVQNLLDQLDQQLQVDPGGAARLGTADDDRLAAATSAHEKLVEAYKAAPTPANWTRLRDSAGGLLEATQKAKDPVGYYQLTRMVGKNGELLDPVFGQPLPPPKGMVSDSSGFRQLGQGPSSGAGPVSESSTAARAGPYNIGGPSDAPTQIPENPAAEAPTEIRPRGTVLTGVPYRPAVGSGGPSLGEAPGPAVGPVAKFTYGEPGINQGKSPGEKAVEIATRWQQIYANRDKVPAAPEDSPASRLTAADLTREALADPERIPGGGTAGVIAMLIDGLYQAGKPVDPKILQQLIAIGRGDYGPRSPPSGQGGKGSAAPAPHTPQIPRGSPGMAEYRSQAQ